jgi:hypothetical protein
LGFEEGRALADHVIAHVSAWQIVYMQRVGNSQYRVHVTEQDRIHAREGGVRKGSRLDWEEDTCKSSSDITADEVAQAGEPQGWYGNSKEFGDTSGGRVHLTEWGQKKVCHPDDHQFNLFRHLKGRQNAL